jgi:lipocalin
MHASMLFRTLLVIVVCYCCQDCCALATEMSDIKLVTFDNAPSTTKIFRQTDDPVMGGKSTGTWTVDTENKIGIFDGNVVDVPRLKAPGFIKAQSANSQFPDISSCSAIVLRARSSTAYTGYRLSFSNKKSLFCSFFSGGFKTHFAAPTGSSFQDIVLPFTSFSDCNSDSTGEPKKQCNDNKSVCPDKKTLEDIETISIWAEGAAGKVHLEIESISATGCKSNRKSNELTRSTRPVTFAIRGSSNTSNTACRPVQTAKNFDLDAYLATKWYIQQQAVTKYLPEKENNCVYAEYERLDKKTFWGYTVQVHNYAQEKNGKAHDSGKIICARVDSDYNDDAKLVVGPCFLPKISGFTTGPYWVLYHDVVAGLAVVSGGQPTIETPNGCRTGTGTNSAGLWIFTHSQERNETLVAKGHDIIKDQGYDLSVLNDVDQKDCVISKET